MSLILPGVPTVEAAPIATPIPAPVSSPDLTSAVTSGIASGISTAGQLFSGATNFFKGNTPASLTRSPTSGTPIPNATTVATSAAPTAAGSPLSNVASTIGSAISSLGAPNLGGVVKDSGSTLHSLGQTINLMPAFLNNTNTMLQLDASTLSSGLSTLEKIKQAYSSPKACFASNWCRIPMAFVIFFGVLILFTCFCCWAQCAACCCGCCGMCGGGGGGGGGSSGRRGGRKRNGFEDDDYERRLAHPHFAPGSGLPAMPEYKMTTMAKTPPQYAVIGDDGTVMSEAEAAKKRAAEEEKQNALQTSAKEVPPSPTKNHYHVAQDHDWDGRPQYPDYGYAAHASPMERLPPSQSQSQSQAYQGYGQQRVPPVYRPRQQGPSYRGTQSGPISFDDDDAEQQRYSMAARSRPVPPPHAYDQGHAYTEQAAGNAMPSAGHPLPSVPSSSGTSARRQIDTPLSYGASERHGRQSHASSSHAVRRDPFDLQPAPYQKHLLSMDTPPVTPPYPQHH